MTATPSSSPSFLMVDPAHVSEVGPAAAILFGLIRWRCTGTGEWRATRRQMITESGLTDNVVRNAVGVLRDRGWVQTRRTSADDATLVWSHVSAGQPELVDSTPPPVDSTPPLTVSAGQPDMVDSTPRPVDSTISSLETGLNTPLPPEGDESESLFPAPASEQTAAGAPDPAAGFDEWYGLYPKKSERKAAAKAYAKAFRDVGPDRLLQGLRAQLPAMLQRVQDGEKQFIKNPATWLNRGCWDDDVPDNVRHMPRVDPGNLRGPYDPEYVAQLPPPRTDPFAAGFR